MSERKTKCRRRTTTPVMPSSYRKTDWTFGGRKKTERRRRRKTDKTRKRR